MRCRMTASFRATATLALRSPLRFASLTPQALSADHLAIQVRNLPPDSLARLEQRLYRGSEFWPRLGQLRGAHGKHVHLCLADDEPEVLEQPAELVLNIPLDLDEQSSADKKGFDRVAVEIFDADL